MCEYMLVRKLECALMAETDVFRFVPLLLLLVGHTTRFSISSSLAFSAASASLNLASRAATLSSRSPFKPVSSSTCEHHTLNTSQALCFQLASAQTVMRKNALQHMSIRTPVATSCNIRQRNEQEGKHMHPLSSCCILGRCAHLIFEMETCRLYGS